MRYKVYTLIDITNTEARFNKNDPEWHRQQNYMTLIQTIGLRTNPIVDNKPKMLEENIKDYDFGSAFKGKHKIWTLEFTTDFSYLDPNILIEDFDLVPIITGLAESAKIDSKSFRTKDSKENNLYFTLLD